MNRLSAAEFPPFVSATSITSTLIKTENRDIYVTELHAGFMTIEVSPWQLLRNMIENLSGPQTFRDQCFAQAEKLLHMVEDSQGVDHT